MISSVRGFSLYIRPDEISIQHFDGAYSLHMRLTAEQALDLAVDLRSAAECAASAVKARRDA
jgi:hypothetical protein